MKAATWQRKVSLATTSFLAFLALAHPTFANAPMPAATKTGPSSAAVSDRDLPAGLPGLPSLGETMQRDSRLGLALNGFDPVTYRLGLPAAGQAQHELALNGIVWRFASAANLAAFRDAPDIYAPAFGGFDPTGVAAGIAVDSDPVQYAVVGSQLYLFRSAANRQRFIQDQAMLALANERWPEVARTIAR